MAPEASPVPAQLSSGVARSSLGPGTDDGVTCPDHWALPGSYGVSSGAIPLKDAAALVSGLAWRGIRGYPKTEDH